MDSRSRVELRRAVIVTGDVLVAEIDAERIEEARHQLARYLSDEIAPMIFANSAADLFKAPPELVAREIRGWIGIQLQGAKPSEICDYLLHSAKKVHHLGELELLPKDDLRGYLAQLAPILLGLCPERDRPKLAANLERLDASTNVVAAQISVGRSPSALGSDEAPGAPHRRASDLGSLPDVPTAPTSVVDRERQGGQAAELISDQTGAHIDRLNLLLDRWERLADRTGATAGAAASKLDASLAGAESALLSRIIDEIASTSRSTSELEGQLRLLAGVGIDGLGTGVFKTLSGALPDWAPSRAPTDAEGPLLSPAETMRKLVDLAADPGEQHRRFAELISTAVDEFNTGALGRCVTVLDLANRMIAQKQVNVSAADNIIDKRGEEIDEARLREYAENEDRQSLLRRVLDTFPKLHAENLLNELTVEERRDRRRLILRLLTVHGETARRHGMRLLRDSVAGNLPLPWFVQRNLIYLIRSIPPAEGTDIEKEIDLLVRASVPGGEQPLVREALTALGQIDHPRSVQTLTARISDLEDVLAEKGRSVSKPSDVQSLLDTAVKALMHFDSKEARHCVVTHGLKRRPELGNTLGRLAMLGTQDLSDDPATVNRIIEAVKDELPVKVFGVSVTSSRKTQNLEALIDSLSGTDIPQVRRLYDGIVKNFPGERFTDVAARALARLGSTTTGDDAAARETSVTSLSGDLALFGLPNLLQNLADSQVEGTLTVLDGAGNAAASITLRDGMMVEASTMARLTGEIAIYQLLERPITGRFIFLNQPISGDPENGPSTGWPVTTLLMEGMRRYDEFNRAATVIPDEARFAATGKQPTSLPDEDDADFVNGIWLQATQGRTPAEIEGALAVDSYRVFRLIEHWLNEDSLSAMDATPDRNDS